MIGSGTKRVERIYTDGTVSGCSRLTRSKATCPLCKTEMIRSAAPMLIVGEDYDYMYAFCPKCKSVGIEEFAHLSSEILAKKRPAPKIEFDGIEIEALNHTRDIVVKFKYGKDNKENDIGNRTHLGEDEAEQFLTMTPEQRKGFILKLGQREWDALEEARLMQEHCQTLQSQFDDLISEFKGKDLLATVSAGKAKQPSRQGKLRNR